MLYDYSKNKKLSKYFQSNQLQVEQELRRYSNAKVQVIRDGPWEQAKITLENMAQYIATSALAGQMSAAKKFKREIERNIRNGGAKFGFQGLSTKTLQLKGQRGQPLTMFNASRAYSKSIILQQTGQVVRVGIKPGARNTMPGSNLTIAQYATILEFGSSRGVPARPLWKRTWKDFGGPQRIRNIMKWHLGNKLRTMGFKTH